MYKFWKKRTSQKSVKALLNLYSPCITKEDLRRVPRNLKKSFGETMQNLFDKSKNKPHNKRD